MDSSQLGGIQQPVREGLVPEGDAAELLPPVDVPRPHAHADPLGLGILIEVLTHALQHFHRCCKNIGKAFLLQRMFQKGWHWHLPNVRAQTKLHCQSTGGAACPGKVPLGHTLLTEKQQQLGQDYTDRNDTWRKQSPCLINICCSFISSTTF